MNSPEFKYSPILNPNSHPNPVISGELLSTKRGGSASIPLSSVPGGFDTDGDIIFPPLVLLKYKLKS